jgi:hypothetical protein
MMWLVEAEDASSPLQYTLQGRMLRTNRYQMTSGEDFYVNIYQGGNREAPVPRRKLLLITTNVITDHPDFQEEISRLISFHTLQFKSQVWRYTYDPLKQRFEHPAELISKSGKSTNDKSRSSQISGRLLLGSPIGFPSSFCSACSPCLKDCWTHSIKTVWNVISLKTPPVILCKVTGLQDGYGD